MEKSFRKPKNLIKHNKEVQLNVSQDIVEHGQNSIRDISYKLALKER